MTIIDDLFKGAVILSIIAVVQNGCSVKEMAKRAANAHKNSLSYGKFSRSLTNHKGSWIKKD